MSRLFKDSSKMVGLPPGTLVHIGDRRYANIRITVFDYNEKKYTEKEIKNIREIFPLKDKPSVTWINVNGIHEPEAISKIGEAFEIHPLVLEDVLNTEQRPKQESFERYQYTVIKMLAYDEKDEEIDSEQVSFILGENFVISFQEKEGDVFDHVRERIRNNKGRVRNMGADYLLYVLLDAIVDSYFLIADKISEFIESLEDLLISNPDNTTLEDIHILKREILVFRRFVLPLKEVIGKLEKSDSKLITERTNLYFRDVYDHTIQIIDNIEAFRDMISGMLDIYLSSVSNKMNEVMKILTIIATIFIPLTFIAGLYGMNFKFMPELTYKWGYFIVLGVMAIVSIIMITYFKRKKWL